MSLDFNEIKDIVQEIYDGLTSLQSGDVADYIPQLATVNPDLFGIAITNMQGETFEIGDTTEEFCLQSCSKPLNYCLVRNIEKNQAFKVHQHVGYEPSGRAFNSFVLNHNGLPHNPFINAGAIMVSSLIHPNLEPSKRFDTVKEFYNNMCGHMGHIGFDNSVFLSEKHHSDRNTSLAYYMRENKAFHGKPTPNSLTETLDLYFQCCSVTCNAKQASIMASTLANRGINPITKKHIVDPSITKDTLALMYSCGMYDFSGQFAFEIGLPAKSGVSGCLLVVIPNHFGICIWSPRLDKIGNSVRGVEFCKQFAKKTKNIYHIFNLDHTSNTVDHEDGNMDENVRVQRFIQAAATNQLSVVRDMSTDLDINAGDYDGRTALHLAAAEGHSEIVQYLIGQNAKLHEKDRWGNTPLHEATKSADKDESYRQIIEMIQSYSPEHYTAS